MKSITESHFMVYHDITYQLPQQWDLSLETSPTIGLCWGKRSGNWLNPCFRNPSHWVNREQVVTNSMALRWVPAVSQATLEVWGQGKGRRAVRRGPQIWKWHASPSGAAHSLVQCFQTMAAHHNHLGSFKKKNAEAQTAPRGSSPGVGLRQQYFSKTSQMF